jgi:hypothetical protein
MKNIFSFWEDVKWYDVKVLNEREARAWAGILFVLAMFSFTKTILTWDFYVTQVFISFFVLDFFIRVVVNPKYAPSLIMGRFMVNNQVPEYVWAAQKKFAWTLWLLLWLFMFYALNLSWWHVPCLWPLCVLCLILLFFETAFGICLGCKMYNFFNKEKAQLCPWWTCELKKREEIQKINLWQVFVLIISIILIVFVVKTWTISHNSDASCGMWPTCGSHK